MKFKSENYGLNEKNNKHRKNGYKFDGILKILIKVDSNPSNINICYYLKKTNIAFKFFWNKHLKNLNIKKYLKNLVNPFHLHVIDTFHTVNPNKRTYFTRLKKSKELKKGKNWWTSSNVLFVELSGKERI